MWINTQSCFLPVLVVGIVSILSLSGSPSYSLALDSRRLLQHGSDGGRFELLHWSHPDAPHYISELSFTEKVKLAVERSRKRVTVLSSTPGSGRLPSFISPLFSIIGEYGMDISIGTPPQTFSAIADTGSDLVWVQCLGCDYCVPEADPLFDPTKSSTYQNMSCNDPFCGPVENFCGPQSTCDYTYGYGSGGTDGVMAYETVTLNTTGGTKMKADNFAFGCDFETFFSLSDVDGLVGLGNGPLSFTTQLSSLYDNKFSYCLVSIYDSNATTSPLLFGDAAVPRGPIQYTPFVQNPNASYFGAETYYYIGLTGIKVNGRALKIPSGTFDISTDGSGGVISDSGTTLTYLTTAAYTLLLAKLEKEISYPLIVGSLYTIGFDLCYNLSNVASPKFPVITMVFEGLNLDLPQQNVFVGGLLLGTGVPSSASCLAFADSASTFSIFGNIQQQNFQILYDREAKRFGYAQVQCDTLSP